MKTNSKAIKFYALLVVCLAITGIIASTAAGNRAKKLADSVTSMPQTTAKTEKSTVGIEITTEVNRNVKGVPDDRYITDNAAAEATTQSEIMRNESYILPLSQSVGKAYSEGELVYSKTMEDWRAHTGVDFQGNAGDSVKAVNNGIIKKVCDDALWGTVIEIDHGDGIVSRYCGLNYDDALAEGTKVSGGEQIGTLGTLPIESADDEHLHFEMLLNGVTVDPFDYLTPVNE